jgi:hypothetical protein
MTFGYLAGRHLAQEQAVSREESRG